MIVSLVRHIAALGLIATLPTVLHWRDNAPATFHAWKRRLRRPQRETGKAARQALVPVQIVSEPAGGVGHLEVQWPGGVVLRVLGCDVQTVGAVVAALSASSIRRAPRC